MEPKKNADWKKDLVQILKSKPARATLAALLGLVALRLGVTWWSQRSMVAAARPVHVGQLKPKNVDKTLTLPGNVDAIEQANLYAHVSGYLKKIMVDEGDKVKKNQLLAVIDAPDVVQEFRNAEADYNFKETTRRRYEQLLKESVVSQQEYDKVAADEGQAKARYENAKANLDYTQVRAPFAGSIARRFKYPGDFISIPTRGTASPLFILVNEERLRVVVNVPQKEVASITIGHAVDIHVDAFPGRTFAGQVSRVDALLDEATKTQRVLIDIANPDASLRAGMFSSVVLHVERKDNVPMIFKDAIHEDGEKSFVFAVRDGKAVKLPVTVGDAEGRYLAITSPELRAGDSVIVSGGEGLADGDPVKVVDEGGK